MSYVPNGILGWIIIRSCQAKNLTCCLSLSVHWYFISVTMISLSKKIKIPFQSKHAKEDFDHFPLDRLFFDISPHNLLFIRRFFYSTFFLSVFVISIPSTFVLRHLSIRHSPFSAFFPFDIFPFDISTANRITDPIFELLMADNLCSTLITKTTDFINFWVLTDY